MSSLTSGSDAAPPAARATVATGLRQAAEDVALRALVPLAYAIARAKARLRNRLGASHMDTELVAALKASPTQATRWARRAAELEASDGLERRLVRRMKPGSLRRLMEIEGIGNLEAALEGGNGAILYSLHLWGKYTFFGALAEAGYPPAVIATAPDDPGRRSWLRAMQERSGYRYIWTGDRNFGVAVEAANVLRSNGVVLAMLDWPQPGMSEVTFLGRRARLATGVAEMARLTGAPLLDYYVYRRSRWVPQVAEIGVPHAASDSTSDVLQQCADRLAEHVRRDPAQWTFFRNHRHSAFVASAPTPP